MHREHFQNLFAFLVTAIGRNDRPKIVLADSSCLSARNKKSPSTTNPLRANKPGPAACNNLFPGPSLYIGIILQPVNALATVVTSVCV